MTGRSLEHRKLIALIDKEPDWKVGPLLHHLVRTNAGMSEEMSKRMYRDELAAVEAAHLARAE